MQVIFPSYNYYIMLDVQPPVNFNRSEEESVQSASFQHNDEVPLQKNQEKKQLLTPYRIIIGIAIFLILVMASYKVYTLAASQTVDQINDAHSKYIQNGDSSSGKDSGSVSGSQSSKSSKNSDKPTGTSKPAGKGPISSNTNTGNFGGNGQGDDDDEEESNESNRRKKIMDKNKADGGSTDEESESIEEDDSEVEEQGMTWSPNMEGGALPTAVGSTRG